MIKKETIFSLIFIIFISFTYGFLSGKFELFPHDLLKNAKQGYKEIKRILNIGLPWYYIKTSRDEKLSILDRNNIPSGLTLISGIGANNNIEARVVDVEGNTVHRWTLNWFELWPDATHVHPDHTPKSPPGTHIHGIALMKSGDLIFNLERAGLFKVDICGRTIWRVPRMTHHSLDLDEDGNIWVPGLEVQESKIKEFPGYIPPFKDFKILKISGKGEIIEEWSVMSLLKANGLESLLYLSSTENGAPLVTGDTLHLNDIDIFPSNLKAGLFSEGDVMISLRNINTVLVFNDTLDSVKHIFSGPFIRQHDPDFVDGNTITLFDNYSISSRSELPHSRILRLSVESPAVETIFSGTKTQPFFTHIMGKHQKLANGNMLLTEAVAGRALEIGPDNQVVWEYYNVVAKGLIGLMDEAQRLPKELNREFFANSNAACAQ